MGNKNSYFTFDKNKPGSTLKEKNLKPPNNFIAGRPMAALLFWIFGDFRCGVPLFIVILVIYKYKSR